MKFCESCNFDPLVITEDQLAMATAHFALGHTVNSVGPYLSALQHLYNEAGAGSLPRGPGFLNCVRGLRRLFGPADVVVRTKALSLPDIHSIAASLDLSDPDDVCFGAEIILAFFLALRTEDHTAGRLRWGDIYPQPDGSVEFLLPPGKVVKTFRKVALVARPDILDPLLWLRRLARCLPASRRGSSYPVFVSFSTSTGGHCNYWALSRGAFIARLKRSVHAVLGYDPQLFAGYSLRRGGVTALVTADVPLPAVKRHVGWTPNSNAFYGYYDHDSSFQLRLPSALLR